MKDDQTKTRKEDNIRCRVLNSLIHKAVTEMMATSEVNQELYDLKLEICKASAKATARVEPLWLHLEVSMACQRSSPGCCDVCVGGVLLHCFWCGRAQQGLDSPCVLGELCHCCTWLSRPFPLWCKCNLGQLNGDSPDMTYFLLLRHVLFALPFQKEPGFANVSVSFQEFFLRAAVWELIPPCVPHRCHYAGRRPKWGMSLVQKKKASRRKWHWQARFQKELEFVPNCS